MSKSKAQGTAFESYIVTLAKQHGLTAERLAEGGTRDPGDIHLIDIDGDHWIIEAKHRANLNQHRAIKDAIAKVGRADLPYPIYKVALAHKRTVRKDGNTNRSADGVGAIVSMELSDFIRMCAGR